MYSLQESEDRRLLRKNKATSLVFNEDDYNIDTRCRV